jgi:glycosyltransferase involved in cell wall biosynthesis
MPTVSVVVPTYNCSALVGEAIESLLAQTRIPDQIIVVNDGSTDDTAAVVQQYCDGRVIYIEQANGGIAAARNRGLSVATGDFIGFLDADDRWLPSMLEKQLAVLERQLDVVCTFANFMRTDEITKRELGDQFRYYPLEHVPAVPGPLNDTHILTGDPFCELVAFNEIPCYVQVTLFRAAVIAGMRFNEDLRAGEDYEFLMRVYLRGRVAYNREILAEVRRHGNNSTSDYGWAPVTRLEALREIKDKIVTREQRLAYSDRLVKAHIDAARVHCSRRSFGDGLSTFYQGVLVPGSAQRKVKGAMRLAWVSCRALLRPSPVLKG